MTKMPPFPHQPEVPPSYQPAETMRPETAAPAHAVNLGDCRMRRTCLLYTSINDFVTAMQGKDHKGLAACFTEDSRLVDYCPSMVKRQNTFLYGRNAIEMSFHNKFMFGGFTMRDPRIVNERTVNFYADYNLSLIHI